MNSFPESGCASVHGKGELLRMASRLAFVASCPLFHCARREPHRVATSLPFVVKSKSPATESPQCATVSTCTTPVSAVSHPSMRTGTIEMTELFWVVPFPPKFLRVRVNRPTYFFTDPRLIVRSLCVAISSCFHFRALSWMSMCSPICGCRFSPHDSLPISQTSLRAAVQSGVKYTGRPRGSVRHGSRVCIVRNLLMHAFLRRPVTSTTESNISPLRFLPPWRYASSFSSNTPCLCAIFIWRYGTRITIYPKDFGVFYY